MSVSSTKSQRSQLSQDLRHLLSSGQGSTQAALCQLLVAQGHPMTQSKISRLLRQIGAVKSKNESGHVVYHLPKEPAPPSADSTLDHLVLNVSHNGNLVVVHTSPGSASLLARMIDHHAENLGTLGQIAGDDTIFVAPVHIDEIEQVVEKIRNLLFK